MINQEAYLKGQEEYKKGFGNDDKVICPYDPDSSDYWDFWLGYEDLLFS